MGIYLSSLGHSLLVVGVQMMPVLLLEAFGAEWEVVVVVDIAVLVPVQYYSSEDIDWPLVEELLLDLV